MIVNDSIQRIRAFAASMKWSRNRIATEAGIAESTIRNIFEDDWNPRVETLRQLEKVIPDDFTPPAEAA